VPTRLANKTWRGVLMRLFEGEFGVMDKPELYRSSRQRRGDGCPQVTNSSSASFKLAESLLD
jgi:hypothetical protein